MTTLLACLVVLLALALVRALTWRAAYKAGYKQGVADADAAWNQKVAKIIGAYNDPNDFGFSVRHSTLKPKVSGTDTTIRLERPSRLPYQRAS